ncbi:MAG: bifunctional 4-hydroxy-2-oxoglutarate aldolase/2-dehydro-3-deoxy-phosphogluconate aldolase [Ruminococcaceae bacterium]|nr:bifunctional 4-hydroxy-2-oxoglutarate aldolase/2-dehydro-3-deoxy-phosphogluconate aldolase [Oscillospiraceae bacterium]
MHTMQEEMKKTGILPVINITNVEACVPLVEAITEEDIHVLEVTLRSDSSLAAIETIKKEFPALTVGAGTIFSVEQLEKALACGADFIVTPGLDEELVSYCMAKGVPIVPGCSTPTEIQKARKLGCRTVKFFPAELSGGPKALSLYACAFADIFFVPTGGINKDNLASYLACNNVVACGGSYMMPKDFMKTLDKAALITNLQSLKAISGR